MTVLFPVSQWFSPDEARLILFIPFASNEIAYCVRYFWVLLPASQQFDVHWNTGDVNIATNFSQKVWIYYTFPMNDLTNKWIMNFLCNWTSVKSLTPDSESLPACLPETVFWKFLSISLFLAQVQMTQPKYQHQLFQVYACFDNTPGDILYYE